MKLTLVGRSPYFGGLRSTLARAIRSLGHDVLEREGMPPVLEGNALIVIGPQDHGPPPKAPDGFMMAALLTEQPGYWGDPLKHPATAFYKTFCDVFRERPAFERPRHFVPVWCEWDPPVQEYQGLKEIDVLWYGAKTDRRAEILRAIDAVRPVHEPAEFLTGDRKRLALRAAKVVPLIRAHDFGLWEPWRMLEAASCSALIVSEPPKVDTSPWVAGEDFLVAPSPEMPGVIAEAVGNWPACAEMLHSASKKAATFSALTSAKELLAACLA